MGIEFIPATCPKCGGELRVPNDREVIKCMYCGADILLHDPSKITIEVIEDASNLLGLAKTAIDAGNFKEAYFYFSRILEHDPNCAAAWLGKGQSMSELSGQNIARQSEALAYIMRGIGLMNQEDTDLRWDAVEILGWAVREFYEAVLYQYSRGQYNLDDLTEGINKLIYYRVLEWQLAGDMARKGDQLQKRGAIFGIKMAFSELEKLHPNQRDRLWNSWKVKLSELGFDDDFIQSLEPKQKAMINSPTSEGNDPPKKSEDLEIKKQSGSTNKIIWWIILVIFCVLLLLVFRSIF